MGILQRSLQFGAPAAMDFPAHGLRDELAAILLPPVDFP
jgi:hypothetical protein